MNTRFKYSTVLEATKALHEKGFNEDFRLEGNNIVCCDKKFDADDLKIAVTYRYEGNTDPGDEATVYGIETNSGEKGILIVADGIYADASTQILKKLHEAKNEDFQQES